jgi:hypothetical protein
MVANQQNYGAAAAQPQKQQKMLIFRVTEAKQFSTGQNTNFEFTARNKSSDVINLQQFQREKFMM